MDPVSLRGTERPSDEPGDKKGIGKAKAKTSRSDSWRIEAVQRENDFFPNLSGDFDEDSPLRPPCTLGCAFEREARAEMAQNHRVARGAHPRPQGSRGCQPRAPWAQEGVE